jgi:hypothetical protein
MPPDYGAISYHWRSARSAGWMLDLYCWRRGPWRASWSVWIGGWVLSGGVETPGRPPFLQRCVTDILWGLKRREVERERA